MPRETLRHDTALSLAGAEFQPPMPAALMFVDTDRASNGHREGSDVPEQTVAPSADIFVAPLQTAAGEK